jgi:replicative DNA helicase
MEIIPQPAALASTISRDVYLRRVAISNNRVAGLLAERDLDGVREAVTGMAQELPADGRHYPDAADAHLEFLAGMDDVSFTLPTGLRPLDNAFGGWDQGTVSLLAARPAMGKTTLAFQLAENQARMGRKSIFFSLEMKRRQLWIKRCCGLLEIDPKVYKTRVFSPEQAEALKNASERFLDETGGRLTVIDTTPLSMTEIWDAVAQLRPEFVVIDHLALVSDRTESVTERLHNIVWAGKTIAKQFDCHVQFLAQLNRGVEARDDKRPGLSDLRDSGTLEQDADLIGFLYRPDYYKKDEAPPPVSDTELIIAKNRDGVMNQQINLEFHLRKQYFFARANAQQMPARR